MIDFLIEAGKLLVLIVAAVLFALGILGYHCKHQADDVDDDGFTPKGFE